MTIAFVCGTCGMLPRKRWRLRRAINAPTWIGTNNWPLWTGVLTISNSDFKTWSRGRNEASSLTGRAEVCAALADDDSPDRRATAGAGVPGLLVGAKLLLMPAPPAFQVGEIGFAGTQGSARIPDSAPQDFPDRQKQGLGFGRLQGVGPAPGMEPGFPERLVRVNIAQSGQERLIQQQRFQSPVAGCQARRESGELEGAVQRLRSQPLKNAIGVAGQLPAAEFAGIQVAEFPAVIQAQNQVLVAFPARGRSFQAELPRHAQMDQQGVLAGKPDDDELAPAPDLADDLAPDPGREGGRGVPGDDVRAEHAGLADAAAFDAGAPQAADQGFDFG